MEREELTDEEKRAVREIARDVDGDETRQAEDKQTEAIADAVAEKVREAKENE